MDAVAVERQLKQIGLKPQRAAGQNFLYDLKVVRQMTAAAQVTTADTILEIGPGLGILTEELLATGARVVAVELDQRLYTYLAHHLAGKKNLELIKGDIFRLNLQQYLTDDDYKLVANLPYSSTSLIFRNFLSLPPRPKSMTVMIQREVAKRITAEPGAMSLLSVMARYYSQPSYLFDVPRQLFYPRPEVDSAVIQCVVGAAPDPKFTKKFFQVVRAGFSARRKQLHNALSAGLRISMADSEKILVGSGVAGDRRAQDLTLDEWLTIAKNLN